MSAGILVAVMFVGNFDANASVVTGTLSLSSTSSASQSGGALGGVVGGGSTVSGTIGGGSGSSGSISGAVGGGSGGGGGGSIGGLGGNSSTDSRFDLDDGFVLGASTVLDTPGLPNTGVGSTDSGIAILLYGVVLSGLFLSARRMRNLYLLSR